MTIKEFARRQGVTPQAVYQKMKAAGLDVSSIKKENSADLTAEGLEAVKALFSKQGKESNKETAALLDKINSLNGQLNEKAAVIETFKARIEELTAERDKWAALAAGLQEALKQEQELAKREQQTAQQAQALNMASIQALKASPRRLSLWQRLTGKREAIPAEAVQGAEIEKKE